MLEIPALAQAALLTSAQQTAVPAGFQQAVGVATMIPPGDCQAGLTGIWYPVSVVQKFDLLFYKAAGTPDDDPLIEVLQAKSNAGLMAKALNFTHYAIKQASPLLFSTDWVGVDQAADNTVQLDETSAESEVILLIEFAAGALDVAGGFTHVQFNVPAVGANPQLASALYMDYNQVAAAGILRAADCVVGLYVNALELLPNVTIDDIVEPVFTGYARLAVTNWVTGNRIDTSPYLVALGKRWQPSALGSGAQTCLGLFLYNTVAAKLVGFWPFAQPLVLNHVGQLLEMSPEFCMSDQAPQELIPSTS